MSNNSPQDIGESISHHEFALPVLPASLQSAASITSELASRFHASFPAARISSNAIVILNTYEETVKNGRETEANAAIPEIVKVAEAAIARLGRLHENQALLFLGELGSGKSKVCSNILTTLLKRSPNRASSAVSLKISVVEALTTIQTTASLPASKSSLIYQLEFDTSGAKPYIVGSAIVNHFLQPNILAQGPKKGGVCPILHYLVAGASDAEKERYGFKNHQGSINRWKILGSSVRLRQSPRDLEGLSHFKRCLWEFNFHPSEIERICELLSAVLHLGQLQCRTSTHPNREDSDNFYENWEDTVTIQNTETLQLISSFLSINASDLEKLILTQTKVVGTEKITVTLDPIEAEANAVSLASMLYTIITRHIIDRMNQETRVPDDDKIKTISLINLAGFSDQLSALSTSGKLLTNSMAEFMYNLSLQIVRQKTEIIQAEDVIATATEYFDNTEAVKALLSPNTGLLTLLDNGWRNNHTNDWLLQRMQTSSHGRKSIIRIKSSIEGLPLTNFDRRDSTASFTVQHFAGEVDYPIGDLMKEDWDASFDNLTRILESSKDDLVASLSRQETTAQIPQSQHTPKDWRSSAASTGQTLHKTSSPVSNSRWTLPNFLSLIRDASGLVRSLNTNLYLVFCLNSNDGRIRGQFSTPSVRAQIQALGIPEIINSAQSVDLGVAVPFSQFLELAGLDKKHVGDELKTVVSLIKKRQWPRNEAVVGSSRVLLSEACWMEMNNFSVGVYATSSHHSTQGTNGSFTQPELKSSSCERLLSSTHQEDENQVGSLNTQKHFTSNNSAIEGAHNLRSCNSMDISTAKETKQRQVFEEKCRREDPRRKLWTFIVYSFTFFIPDIFIHRLGGMSKRDVRMAWREKLAINMIIWTSCAITIFFVMVVPLLICPKQHVLNAKELSSYNGKKGSKGSYVTIRGEIFDLAAFIPHHYPPYLDSKLLKQYAGSDISSLFPVQVSALCAGVNGSLSDSVTLDTKPYNFADLSTTVTNSQDLYAKYHDFRSFTNDSRPDWFSERMTMLRARYKKGTVGYSTKSLAKLAKESHLAVGIIEGRVYDLTAYISGGRLQYTKTGKLKHDDLNAANFMDQSVVDIFQLWSGADITRIWKELDLEVELKTRMKDCLDNLFYIGDLDSRNSTKCQFAEYLPLVVSVILGSVIAFKFAASMQLSAKKEPERLDKFIICQITAYTEDEESLRRAIDSIARMQYDDKRKLLVVICDGMVVGEGNDRSTPRIVLDIFGVSPNISPQHLSFESIGQGSQQHNMGQVYCGLYEVYGHLVPFLIIVKVGRPSEHSRPGNRGKRDSQMILMRFLNRVHYGLAMSPLELEIYNVLYNIIGVHPALYEFLLQIDTDTIVSQDSATQMLSALADDMRLIAVCGETGLSNAKSTAVTMLQVYEYFISHNLSKAFESLFGCVTCLPGCFSMFRVFDGETGKPLFISNQIVESYAVTSIDTLHMKNLLSLGEDRYLTTLLLKYHRKYKIKYLSSARAWTIAPETWEVFLSQRRRWINSTVHNLVELLSINQICGFYVFSMHFVVIIDLITTVIQPVAIAYIIYLIVQLIRNPSILPIMAIVILAIVYGIQVIVFLVRRKWDMAGWMLVYLAALPIFSLCLPLYSFWYMDDFEWGNTRMVAGEVDKIVAGDDDSFELEFIPRKTWEEYHSAL